MEKSKTTYDNIFISVPQAGQDIEVILFTDPLCCWSWVFEPQLKKIAGHLFPRASWHLKMGGLIPDWAHFNDAVNCVNRPAQMGPVWMHAGQMAGIPINHQIWFKDPPVSSYPSCIAVKCAQLQSSNFGWTLLQLLHDACMLNGINIAKQQNLYEIAAEMANITPAFNLNRFKSDYENENGMEAFRADLDLTKKYSIERFPSLIVKSAEKAILISGYRDFSEVIAAIKNIVSDLP